MGPMNLAEKLERLRRRAGLSQGELAASVGTYQSRISEWELAKGGPNLAQALRLARLLGVPLDYLADDAQDEPPPASALSEDERYVLRTLRALGLDAESAIRGLHFAAMPRAEAPAPAPDDDWEGVSQVDMNPRPAPLRSPRRPPSAPGREPEEGPPPKPSLKGKGGPEPGRRRGAGR
jgi:transcriptional regulator with XRE-family HTH domain